MKFLPVFLGFLVAMSSSFSVADVLVVPADGVEILAINGQEVDRESHPSISGDIQLDNGRNQLLVTHTTEIRDTGNEAIFDTSTAQVVLFEAQDSRLRLMAPEIGSRHEMRTFDEGGQWHLVDAGGEPIPYESAVLEKQGLQFGRDYEAELRRFNQSASPAAMAILGEESFAFDSPVAAATAPEAMPFGAAEGVNDSGMYDQQMVGKMLKFWYQQASSTTRNDFNRWLSESQ